MSCTFRRFTSGVPGLLPQPPSSIVEHASANSRLNRGSSSSAFSRRACSTTSPPYFKRGMADSVLAAQGGRFCAGVVHRKQRPREQANRRTCTARLSLRGPPSARSQSRLHIVLGPIYSTSAPRDVSSTVTGSASCGYDREPRELRGISWPRSCKSRSTRSASNAYLSALVATFAKTGWRTW